MQIFIYGCGFIDMHTCVRLLYIQSLLWSTFLHNKKKSTKNELFFVYSFATSEFIFCRNVVALFSLALEIRSFSSHFHATLFARFEAFSVHLVYIRQPRPTINTLGFSVVFAFEFFASLYFTYIWIVNTHYTLTKAHQTHTTRQPQQFSILVFVCVFVQTFV